MTKQAAVATRDHGAGVAEQRLDRMAGRRCLPLIPMQMAGAKEDLCDVLLARAVAIAVESAQHALHPRPLLGGYARVGWNGPTMDSGQQAIDGFEPVETVAVERDDGCNRVGADGQGLQVSAVAERHHRVGALLIELPGSAFDDVGQIAGLNEDRRRRGQDDDAGIILSQPVDGCGLGFERRICREIATSSAAGFSP